MDIPTYIEQIKKKLGHHERLRVGQKAESEPTRGQLVSPWEESAECDDLHPDGQPSQKNPVEILAPASVRLARWENRV